MKNKFLQATFILMIGGLVTKLLGFAIRIIYTRMVGSDAINLYSLVMPTYSLLLTIATLSLPVVISKLISEHKTKSLKILFPEYYAYPDPFEFLVIQYIEKSVWREQTIFEHIF